MIAKPRRDHCSLSKVIHCRIPPPPRLAPPPLCCTTIPSFRDNYDQRPVSSASHQPTLQTPLLRVLNWPSGGSSDGQSGGAVGGARCRWCFDARVSNHRRRGYAQATPTAAAFTGQREERREESFSSAADGTEKLHALVSFQLNLCAGNKTK